MLRSFGVLLAKAGSELLGDDDSVSGDELVEDVESWRFPSDADGFRGGRSN
jgi:hypothetical protein